MVYKSGIYGFRKNGVDKVTWIYPGGSIDCLGKTVLQHCQRNFAMDLIFDRIELVEGSSRPTREQITECIAAGYCDPAIGKKPNAMWYFALENVRNDFNALWRAALARGRAYMINLHIYLSTGVYNYAYVINLDTGNLEFWIGYMKKPQMENRYTDKYNKYHSHLIAEYPIKDIVAGGSLGIDGFIWQMDTAEEQYWQKEAG